MFKKRKEKKRNAHTRQHNMSTDTVHKSTTDSHKCSHTCKVQSGLAYRAGFGRFLFKIWPGVKPC